MAGVGGGGISRANLTGESAVKGGESRHVFHVAMALSPGDDALSDEQRAQVATDYSSLVGELTASFPGPRAQLLETALVTLGADH